MGGGRRISLPPGRLRPTRAGDTAPGRARRYGPRRGEAVRPPAGRYGSRGAGTRRHGPGGAGTGRHGPGRAGRYGSRGWARGGTATGGRGGALRRGGAVRPPAGGAVQLPRGGAAPAGRGGAVPAGRGGYGPRRRARNPPGAGAQRLARGPARRGPAAVRSGEARRQPAPGSAPVGKAVEADGEGADKARRGRASDDCWPSRVGRSPASRVRCAGLWPLLTPAQPGHTLVGPPAGSQLQKMGIVQGLWLER
jgi:hypothetical protein